MPEIAAPPESLSAALARIGGLLQAAPEDALRQLVDLAAVAGLAPADTTAIAMLGIRVRRGLLDTAALRGELGALLARLAAETTGGDNEPALSAIRAADQRISERSAARAVAAVPVFQCTRLSKTWPGGFTLGALDLSLHAGEITGVVGQNAHGKTTLLRMVAGELSASGGTTAYPLIEGSGVSHDWTRIRSLIAYVPQELPPWRGRLRETLLFEAATHGVAAADNRREVEFMVARLGLAEHIDKAWNELSGGFKLRFALARALVWKPRLLVLDEPLANLDVLAKSALLEDIRDLAQSARNPIAILVSSHDLFDLERVCQQMVFLRRGEIAYAGPARGVEGALSHNLFLLTTAAPEEQLREVLRAAGITEVREEGLNFLISTGLDTGPAELLRILLAGGVVPDYFRDISRSIRRLFE